MHLVWEGALCKSQQQRVGRPRGELVVSATDAHTWALPWGVVQRTLPQLSNGVPVGVWRGLLGGVGHITLSGPPAFSQSLSVIIKLGTGNQLPAGVGESRQ